MHITFIKPNIGRPSHGLYVDEGRMEPLQIGVLAGLTPLHHEIAFYDDRMETIPYDVKTHAVALTVESFTARRAYEIATTFHERGVPVIMGGMHVTLLPEEATQYADAIVTGDAETVWHQVLEDLENNCLQARYDGPPSSGQIGGTEVDRAIFAGKGYLPITLLQFSRGCHFSCEFCAISQYFCRRHYTRPVNEVIAEIKAQKRKLLFFVDDNMAADKDALKELCEALIPLKVRWVSQGSMDMLDDPELMRLLIQSGCLGFVIGFESLNEDNLKAMRKAPNRKRQGSMDNGHYAEVIEELRAHGLQTWAAFTIGHDHDTVDSILATADFAIQSKFTFAAYNVLMPYPGTPLYDRLKADGRLLYDGHWWIHPEYRFNHAAFKPKLMTADELSEVGFECRKRFNSVRSITSRFFEPRTNLSSPYRAMTYLLYNPLFRKEVHKKQGLHFGLEDTESTPWNT